jgi:hypothetical protein
MASRRKSRSKRSSRRSSRASRASRSGRRRSGYAAGGIVLRPPPGSKILPDNDQWTNRFQIRSSSSNKLWTIAQNKEGRWWGCSCPGWITHRKCHHLEAVGLPNKQKPFEVEMVSRA